MNFDLDFYKGKKVFVTGHTGFKGSWLCKMLVNAEKMPEFSIIVPIYKVEKYLEICIDSIIGQSFCNFELILVDDGSPDTCGEICDRYSSSDTRVKVVHL